MFMIKFIVVLAAASITIWGCMGQTSGTLNAEKATKDSLAHVKAVADSLKWEKLISVAQYPYVKGSKWSGVIPVADPAEIPDPNHTYKLLFEFVEKNPDSLAKEINFCLDEVARILNLHIASGIPAKKIVPVIVVHGPGLDALTLNERYQKKHSMDNPNLGIIKDLKNVGAKFIVCGQAMAFFEITKEELLPEMRVALTAQTVLSDYEMQGFVLYSIEAGK